mmetsp:Transcript_55624/g.161500  ORF Transcript_55624/g.161500 Transcript_55624/m.161500 type:complete len:206 (+) Transcript_55624:929-1546(+)
MTASPALAGVVSANPASSTFDDGSNVGGGTTGISIGATCSACLWAFLDINLPANAVGKACIGGGCSLKSNPAPRLRRTVNRTWGLSLPNSCARWSGGAEDLTSFTSRMWSPARTWFTDFWFQKSTKPPGTIRSATRPCGASVLETRTKSRPSGCPGFLSMTTSKVKCESAAAAAAPAACAAAAAANASWNVGAASPSEAGAMALS